MLNIILPKQVTIIFVDILTIIFLGTLIITFSHINHYLLKTITRHFNHFFLKTVTQYVYDEVGTNALNYVQISYSVQQHSQNFPEHTDKWP